MWSVTALAEGCDVGPLALGGASALTAAAAVGDDAASKDLTAVLRKRLLGSPAACTVPSAFQDGRYDATVAWPLVVDRNALDAATVLDAATADALTCCRLALADPDVACGLEVEGVCAEIGEEDSGELLAALL